MFFRAKLKYCPYWPSVVIKPPNHLKERKNKTCVLFFATKNYGFVSRNNIVSYASNRSTFVQKGKGVLFKQAVENMDQYISNPQLFRDNISIDPLNEDVEVKEEPDDSENEKENVEPHSPGMKNSTDDTKRDELIKELSQAKSKNSSMFLELQNVKKSNALLQSLNTNLERELNEIRTTNQQIQKTLTAAENEKQKLVALVDQLRKGISQRESHDRSQNSKDMSSANADDIETFEVEQILDHKTVGRKWLFLVRWENYDSSHDQWIPEKDLFCRELLDNYLKSKNLL